MVTLKKTTKEKLRASSSTESLRWIMEIPLRLKCSSPYGGLVASNDGLWRPPVVVGGGGGGGGVRVLGVSF